MNAHKSTGVRIHIEADHELQVRDVWPDGDAPDVVTAEDVRAAMEACGGVPKRVLADWMLLDDLEVTAIVSRPLTDPPSTSHTGWEHTEAEVWP